VSAASMIVARFVALIVTSLLASGVFLAHGQNQNTVLSDDAKADIVESLLQLVIEAPFSEFKYIRKISSDNIGSVPTTRIAKHGFSVLSADQIRTLRNDNFLVEYVILRRMDLRGSVVTVNLSRVIEGRPCFAPPFFREESFTYEYKEGAKGWVGRLVQKPLPFSFGRNLAIKP
jgi:hypothetical protein